MPTDVEPFSAGLRRRIDTSWRGAKYLDDIPLLRERTLVEDARRSPHAPLAELSETPDHIHLHGDDMLEIRDWTWSE